MRGACADLGTHARGKDAVATVVVDKLRRRMRQNGYRAHMTLQVRLPSAGKSLQMGALRQVLAAQCCVTLGEELSEHIAGVLFKGCTAQPASGVATASQIAQLCNVALTDPGTNPC